MKDLKDEVREFLEENVECVVRQKRFRHKVTGEIVTQVPILEFDEYEEFDEVER